MHGVVYVAHTIKVTAGVGYSARCQYGAPLQIRKIMPGNYGKRSMDVYTLRMIRMNKYEFILTFSLPAGHEDTGQYLDALYEAGCSDALIGTGQPGTIALEFVREAESAEAAVNSAIDNVKTAVPGAELTEVKPDLVGLTDVAELLQCSRQNIRKYMVGHADFPRPVYTGTASLWHLWELANFKKFDIPQTIIELSRTTFQINLDIQQHRYKMAVKEVAGDW